MDTQRTIGDAGLGPQRGPQSTVARNVLRIVGAVLLLGGLYFAITGGIGVFNPKADGSESDTSVPGFPDSATDDGFADPQPKGSDFGKLVGGGFATVFGLAALNAGFLGAQSRYAANQVSPAVREVGMAFRGEGGDGDRGGRFCSECGTRTNAGAKFCDSCGHALT